MLQLQRKYGISIAVVVSYALDWLVLIGIGLLSFGLNYVPPNKRPFSLDDPSISFPFAEHSAVPMWLLLVLNTAIPVVIIALVTIAFVPGPTVPQGTPRNLIWKQKLWELHVGLLGLGLSLVLGWFFTQGMKNMFGKPRPDLLARCRPDLANASAYLVSAVTGDNVSRLYSAAICQNEDKGMVEDGFRSYPSGHSSSAAAGLVYLSLFLASKFAVTIPFAPVNGISSTAAAASAFPNQLHLDQSTKNASRQSLDSESGAGKTRDAVHNATVQSTRAQAAAPPLYLLVLVLVPFSVSIYIAASRYSDFRHHGFDILFGWLMGLVASIYSFRYYHLSLQDGAGWAWGPRSRERAFWAGVGRVGYAGDSELVAPGHHADSRTASSSNVDFEAQSTRASDMKLPMQRPARATATGPYHPAASSSSMLQGGQFSNVEIQPSIRKV